MNSYNSEENTVVIRQRLWFNLIVKKTAGVLPIKGAVVDGACNGFKRIVK